MPQHYPFSAVLGADHTLGLDDMALALVLVTIAPEIGGVLVRGEKGTAKSTAVRALAAVLPPIEVVEGDRFSVDPEHASAHSPDGPFDAEAAVLTRTVRLVELPVGATEDRVLGSVHLATALSSGKVEFEPGLLARAHRGVLYVDEVNLLHDHLVDLLLDAAAMGTSTVERDGISVQHPARFVLVGTMNPEEGELRPQLLDRFGLTAEVAAPREPHARVDVVRRRIAYDADPDAFAAQYADAEATLTARIVAARALLAQVTLSDAALLKIAEICAAFEVEGLRADIVTARAAVAHAAWSGRDRVTLEDLRAAARLALPHRRRRNPFDAPGLDEDELDRLLGDEEPPPDPPEQPEPPTDGPQSTDQPAPSSDGDPGSTEDAPTDGGQDVTEPAGDADTDAPAAAEHEAPATGGRTVVAAEQRARARLFKVADRGAGDPGRRSPAITRTGRRTGAVAGSSGSLHLLETIRAAAPHQGTRGAKNGRLEVRADDLRVGVHEGRESNLVLFCVDASGSMAARRRMAEVKGAVLALLMDAYRRRDKVGLVSFRGNDARLELPPTHSVEIAATRLDNLPAGGRTPLAEGLIEARTVLQRERIRDPRRRALLIVLTDGRATAGADAVLRSRLVADDLARSGASIVLLDCEQGPLRLGLALTLAQHLGAEYLPVSEVSAEVLASTVRERVA